MQDESGGSASFSGLVVWVERTHELIVGLIHVRHNTFVFQLQKISDTHLFSELFCCPKTRVCSEDSAYPWHPIWGIRPNGGYRSGLFDCLIGEYGNVIELAAPVCIPAQPTLRKMNYGIFNSLLSGKSFKEARPNVSRKNRVVP